MASDKSVPVFLALILGMTFFLSIEAVASPKDPGILLADDQGKILYSQNQDVPYAPASIFKLLTSLAAMDTLGTGHRFKTFFSYNRASGNLYIKGVGDPLFISEVISEMSQKIIDQIKAQVKAQAKSLAINEIILDNTYFDSRIRIPGTGDSLNPYDATTGALCANFNTVSFKWDQRIGRFISPEPQTPLLPEFLKTIQATGQKQGRILLDPKQRNLYPGLLIKYFLEKKGITVLGAVRLGPFEGTKGQTGIFESPFTLEQIIQKLLQYSNNFMANQLMLVMGVQRSKAPATLEKGVNALKSFAQKKLGLSNLIIAEGSGISRQTKISPNQMLHILMKFMPFHDLLTLKGNEYYKTGTLSDVRCRAGFFLGENKKLYPFVIMTNQENKRVDSVRQDLLRRVSILARTTL